MATLQVTNRFTTRRAMIGSDNSDHLPKRNSINFMNIERSQNTVLLASTQAVYKAPHSTVRHTHRQTHAGYSTHTVAVSSHCSRKSQSVRLEHNTVESVAASCTYASVINASKCIQCICCVQM